MPPSIFSEVTGGCVVRVLVRPSAKISRVIEANNEALFVDVESPPEKSKANKELLSILSQFFDIPKAEIAISRGVRSREKYITIGRPQDTLQQIIHQKCSKL